MKISSEEKAMWLEDWRQSRKSAWVYAKENRLNPQTFVKWTKTAAIEKQSFVEVSMPVIVPAMNAPEAHAPEILIEKGEIKIHIPLCVWAQGAEVVMEGLRRAI